MNGGNDKSRRLREVYDHSQPAHLVRFAPTVEPFPFRLGIPLSMIRDRDRSENRVYVVKELRPLNHDVLPAPLGT